MKNVKGLIFVFIASLSGLVSSQEIDMQSPEFKHCEIAIARAYRVIGVESDIVKARNECVQFWIARSKDGFQNQIKHVYVPENANQDKNSQTD